MNILDWAQESLSVQLFILKFMLLLLYALYGQISYSKSEHVIIIHSVLKPSDLGKWKC